MEGGPLKRMMFEHSTQACFWNTNPHSHSIFIKEYTQMRAENGKRVKIHAFGCKPLHSCIFPTARLYFTKFILLLLATRI